MTNNNKYTYNKFLNQLNFLNQKRHSLNYLQESYINPILRNRLNQIDNNILKSLIISHTSHQILNHNESLRPLTYRLLNILGFNCSNNIKRIYAKKSMASFHIQKNNLLGLKIELSGHNYYNFLYKNSTKTNIDYSIRDLISLKEIEKDYDLILRSFPNLNQLGCRITFNSNKKLKNERLIELKRLNRMN